MSKKVVIEIDDNFAGVLTVTAARALYMNALNITTYVVDLNKGTGIRIDENGKGWQNDSEGDNG